MVYYTNSIGIYANHKFLTTALGAPLQRQNKSSYIPSQDAFIGWGFKNNCLKIKQQAIEKNLPFWHLEDGFIGYVGHPAKKGHCLSIVKDAQGMYYHAGQSSDLEQFIIRAGMEPELCLRADRLIAKIKAFGITKYNLYPYRDSHRHLPSSLQQQLKDRPYVLLVDQVAGDLSIRYSQAGEDDFLNMVLQAQREHPDTALVVRTHPDQRLGKKSGVLAKHRHHPALQSVIWVTEPCHPHALIAHSQAVFTVSSQMGFEALLLGKPVYCFGLPFYAGWGLTTDTQSHPRRAKLAQTGITLPQLAAAALILYPRYVNPITNKRCEVEEIIELLALQQRNRPRFDTLYLVGFSLWKRAFVSQFCADLAHNIKFVRKAPTALADNDKLLVWGQKLPHIQNAIRVEDGFIRSSGLGSNLCRPASLIFDECGIYFNAERDNDLRQLLNTAEVNQTEQERANKLINKLVRLDVNKYNLSTQSEYQPLTTRALSDADKDQNRRRLLVIGQVDGDASIMTGSPVIKSNEALLWAVRAANPDAHILYKAHPDVVAGNRSGTLSAACLTQCVDEQVESYGLSQLYPHIDELHTMTSLSGFEALLRGVKVVTWGQPFYAGWGLTEDQHPPLERQRVRNLAELVYLSLIAYPRYIDWNTGLTTTPEWLVAHLAENKSTLHHRANFMQRWKIKLSYLMDTLKSA